MGGKTRKFRKNSCGQRNGMFKQGMKDTSAYHRWNGMIGRCYNTKNKKFHRYGGRGISVCARWRKSFLNFFDDMGHPPLGTSLDRIDNNGNYEPSNCRWATPKQQQNNRSDSRVFFYLGETRKLSEISMLCGISSKLIRQRVDRDGLSIELATTKFPYIVN